ncbi:hypothetical protein TNCV_1676001 [Trichonephila clavipes]|nr:hypothetical protein TNCV_1676001 [Trichonephila clavipes]
MWIANTAQARNWIPNTFFSCSSIVGAFLKIGNDCSMDILNSDRAMDVAMAVIHAFGNIRLYPQLVLLLQPLHFVIHDNNNNGQKNNED